VQNFRLDSPLELGPSKMKTETTRIPEKLAEMKLIMIIEIDVKKCENP
jgi:hypothetical protein